MGNSKIVMLSGIYLILGMYTLSFHQNDNLNSSSVISVATTVQAEHLAKAGISLALAKMGSDAALFSYSTQSSTVESGTILYRAEQPVGYPSTDSKITSTGVFSGDTVSVTAVFQYDRGRWRILRVYSPPVM